MKHAQKNNKLVKEKNKCIDVCENDNIYKYEYNNICSEKCPNNTYPLFNNSYICFDPTPKGFYLDTNDNIFKKCYETCKYCYSEGNEANNNCIECITNYTLLNESSKENNCYIRCSYYYLFDESNIYECTEDIICPGDYNKLIKEKNKCIDICENDNIYLFIY